jgi:nucleotide-binding universal stress UspA family protein
MSERSQPSCREALAIRASRSCFGASVRKAGVPVLVVGPKPRGPYERVLLALEAAPESRGVAETARRIVPDAVRASVLHVVEVPFEGYARLGRAPEEHIRRQRTGAGKSSRKALDEVTRAFTESGVTPRVLLRHGDARVAILEAARRSCCDLVVVGTHGRGGITHVLIGSVAQEVVRSAPSDVLVVPTPNVVYSP